jgi:enoyl-CoA hydratase/carnithine racemase
MEHAAEPGLSSHGQAAVQLRRDREVLWASINRPGARNAIDVAVIEGFERMVAVAEECEAKLLVIRGAEGTFCAGADLLEVERLLSEPDRLREFMVRLGAIFDRLESAPWVNLAVVEGFALAGGCELLLACDVVLAAESASIGDRHAEYGLAPAGGSSVRLTEALPRARARHLLLSGEMISGREAALAGLVSVAVPDELLEAELGELVATLRTRGRSSLATIKAMLEPADEAARRARLDREIDLFLEHAASGEMQAGLRAFRERSPSNFD